jgi:NAD(P) transhydrogenase subunit beta
MIPAALPDIMYVVAAVLFIFGIKRVTKVQTARFGNVLGGIGMLLAIVATLLHMQSSGTGIGWMYIGIAALIGSLIGAFIARLAKITAMPQTVAIFHALVSCAAVLVVLAVEIVEPSKDTFTIFTAWISIIIGAVACTGSLVAFAKLQELLPGRPILYPGRAVVVGLVAVATFVVGALVQMHGTSGAVGMHLHYILVGLASVLGVLLTISIGGADMPVVISLLNSYTGLANATAGFVLGNTALIITGALVGASGFILTKIMCKAMNRSLANVIFGGVGQQQTTKVSQEYSNIKESSPEEAALILDSASSIIVVPGYGFAVAQAQHALKELSEALAKKGKDVKFAIHPVAGRMPGHMNVLLAEADVPYEKLYELERINGEFKNTDVVIVVGANDVVNPAAAQDASSPLFGMPILNAHEARTVIFIKRGLSPGFAGVKNSLFEADNCRMLFMDAKEGLQGIVKEFKEL